MVPSPTLKRDNSTMQSSRNIILPQSGAIGASLATGLLLALVIQLFPANAALAGSARDSVEARSAKKSGNAEEITWMKYEDGVKLAKEQDKQILIDFSTAWCGYCKKWIVRHSPTLVSSTT